MKLETFRRFLPLACLCLAALLLAGCSTPQTRAKERPLAFEKLSPKQQDLVMRGLISEGMNSDAVYIAMGSPARIVSGRLEKSNFTRWIYGRTQTDVIPAYSYRPVVGPYGQVYMTSYYDPEYFTYQVDSYAVIFKNGKVVGWEEL
jgi:hypothetical protein